MNTVLDFSLTVSIASCVPRGTTLWLCVRALEDTHVTHDIGGRPPQLNKKPFCLDIKPEGPRHSGQGRAEAMMKILIAFVILLVATGGVHASQEADEQAIREIQGRWDDAWNRHDVKALSALVAEDVRFVNVAGAVLN